MFPGNTLVLWTVKAVLTSLPAIGSGRGEGSAWRGSAAGFRAQAGGSASLSDPRRQGGVRRRLFPGVVGKPRGGFESSLFD